MKNICQPGDSRSHSFKVSSADFPEFQGEVVHEVCSTYKLAKEIEWTTRLFVIDILDNDEEGIGTMLTIDHISPAFDGDMIMIEAKVESMKGKELICSYIVHVEGRVIAEGKTGQRILKKEKLARIFSNL